MINTAKSFKSAFTFWNRALDSSENHLWVKMFSFNCWKEGVLEVKGQQKGGSMLLNESRSSIHQMEENSCKPLYFLWGHLSDQRASFLFSLFSCLSLVVVSCVSLCPNTAVNMRKGLLKLFSLLLFFLLTFLHYISSFFLCSLFSLPPPRLCSLLQSQQTKWKHMKAHLLTDSQNSSLWGHSVSQLCVAHEFHCSEMEIQPHVHW